MRSLRLLAGFLLLLASHGTRASAESRAPASATQPGVRQIVATDLPIPLRDASPELSAWIKAFEPEATAFTARLRETPPDPDFGWRQIDVRYPSPVQTPWPENNTVPAELYLPAQPAAGKLPAAIVLDILDGSAIIPRALARGLAEQGVAAIYVPMACYGPRRPADNAHVAYFAEKPERTVENFRQTVMDIRRAKTLLAAMPEIDADRISITGVSMGGIMTSLAAGVDGTFHRVVPILAGGDVAAITFHANESRKIRQMCIEKGITQEKLAEMLKPVEPLTFAKRIDPDRCLMINASLDEVIPPATTKALREAIGNPVMLTVPAGHYKAALWLPKIRQGTIDFILGKKVEKL